MLAAESQRLACQSIDQLAPDDELLRRYADSRDEEAFAELVRRHGSLVLGVGRRVLGDHHAGEDILQATFLLLAKKADQIRWQRTIAPWLYSVAYRIAKKAQRRRRTIASLSELVPVSSGRGPSDPSQPLLWKEVQSAIDEELSRMSDALRGPLVLCYLQGRSRDEAAESLGVSFATLKRRLEHGRNLLRERLTRRGLALSAFGGVLAIEERTLPAAAAHEIARAITIGNASRVATSLLSGTFAGGKKAVVLSLLTILGLGVGLLFIPTPQPAPSTTIVSEPDNPATAIVDVSRDSLPDGAVSRLGTTRLRPARYDRDNGVLAGL